MKKEFKPIAMRCTEEQFNELKPRLDEYKLTVAHLENGWNGELYLINNYFECKLITNCNNDYAKKKDYELIETFNADLFLQCCGVEQTFTLTKSEIIKNKDLTLKEMFKGVFEVELEVGKWYRYNDCLLNYQGLNEDLIITAYGFLQLKTWADTDSFGNTPYEWTLATEEEVKTALENEAIKLGFKEGVYYDATNIGYQNQKKLKINNNKFKYHDNILTLSDWVIFKNGKWATIIPQKEMTVAEIEKELGYNIKIIK